MVISGCTFDERPTPPPADGAEPSHPEAILCDQGHWWIGPDNVFAGNFNRFPRRTAAIHVFDGEQDQLPGPVQVTVVGNDFSPMTDNLNSHEDRRTSAIVVDPSEKDLCARLTTGDNNRGSLPRLVKPCDPFP